MGWLIAAGVIALLAVLPLGIRAIYQEEGAVVWLITGPVRVKVFPSRKKKEKKQEPVKKKKKTASAPAAQKQKQQKGGSFQDFLPLLDLILGFLRTFRRKLRVNRLELKLILAADDPCDLAVNYGKAWAALGNLIPPLERLFVIKKRDLEVECDFTSDKTLIFARLDITITIGRLLSILTVHGIRILRQYFAIMKTRKGGVKI